MELFLFGLLCVLFMFCGAFIYRISFYDAFKILKEKKKPVWTVEDKKSDFEEIIDKEFEDIMKYDANAE